MIYSFTPHPPLRGPPSPQGEGFTMLPPHHPHPRLRILYALAL